MDSEQSTVFKGDCRKCANLGKVKGFFFWIGSQDLTNAKIFYIES